MRKKFFAYSAVLLILIITLAVFAWDLAKNSEITELKPVIGNGVYQEEERRLENTYSGLDVRARLGNEYAAQNFYTNINIIIDKKNDSTLKVIADSNLLEYISTDIKDKTLFIVTQKPLQAQNKIIIEIGESSLEKINFAGEGSIKSNKPLSRDNMEIQYQGGGELDLEIAAKNINLKYVAAATKRINMMLKGNCINFTAFSVGAGVIDARNLIMEKATVAVYRDNSQAKIMVSPEKVLEIADGNLMQTDETGGINVIAMRVKMF
ncbi:MAG: DUF2807 domain-containing protein [Sporomusaceae bacterium]|nr:DUF2807 domain-containing protein [Sporomusaceae bacterium]